MVHPAGACNRIPAAFGVALNAPVQEAEPRCRAAAAKHEFHAVAVPDNELLCMLELHLGILALLGSQQRAQIITSQLTNLIMSKKENADEVSSAKPSKAK